jgi:hypothetical protein
MATYHLLGNVPLSSFPNCERNISSLLRCSSPSGRWKSCLYINKCKVSACKVIETNAELCQVPYLFKCLAGNGFTSSLAKALIQSKDMWEVRFFLHMSEEGTENSSVLHRGIGTLGEIWKHWMA